MKIRVWRWVNDFLLVDYPFKTQIGLSNKIQQQKQKSFNWRQFCHSNFNPRSCHTSHHIFLSSHLSRWQHRKWETVLRTVSWLNQLSEVCLLSVCKENFGVRWHGFRWVITWREERCSLCQEETYSTYSQNARLERINHKACKSSTLCNTVFMLGFWQWYSSPSMSVWLGVIRFSCAQSHKVCVHKNFQIISVIPTQFLESAILYYHDYSHLQYLQSFFKSNYSMSRKKNQRDVFEEFRCKSL